MRAPVVMVCKNDATSCKQVKIVFHGSRCSTSFRYVSTLGNKFLDFLDPTTFSNQKNVQIFRPNKNCSLCSTQFLCFLVFFSSPHRFILNVSTKPEILRLSRVSRLTVFSKMFFRPRIDRSKNFS